MRFAASFAEPARTLFRCQLSCKKALPMSMVGFPLLLIPLAIYNIVVFLMPGVSFTDPLFKLTLMSGAEWPITLSDMLLAIGVLMLLLEVVKGARPGAKYLTDHLLSLIVFGAAAAEFLLWPKFATSTYCLLALLSLADFLSGVALRTRRGTVRAAVPAAAPTRTAEREVETPRAEPKLEVPQAAPAAPAPSAASVAESVLTDRPEPKPAQPDEPTIASPGLQPASGSSASPEAPQR
jgi:hypothetical protein